jgi:hypothetical protein
VFFEELPDYKSDLALSSPNKQIESVNHPGVSGGNPQPLIAKYNQLRPPIPIKELLRRAASHSPLPRILIPM